MEIRYATCNDDPFKISDIYEKSWKFAYRGMIPQSYLDCIPAGQWANGINNADMHNLLLIENGMMVGTASFCQSRWEAYRGYGEIVSIYFLPDYMGKGYGKLLLDKCIEELKKLGFRNVLLWVLEDNHRARKFYEKNGFVCAEVFMEDNIGGQDIREVLYFLA